MNRIKRKCRHSIWSFILPSPFVIGMVFLLYTIIVADQLFVQLIFGAMLLFFLLPPLYFSLVSVEVDDEAITLHFPIRHRSFKLRDIAFAENALPAQNEWCTNGATGYFGFYGWFRNDVLNRFFAYYGRRSECFIIRLRSGKIYMIGCKDHEAVLQWIKDRIS